MGQQSTFIFVTGGVRSGKTTFAEKLAMEYAEKDNLQLHYLATGVVTDNEMKERVERHQKIRAEQKQQWKTWEQKTGLQELLPNFSKQDILLFDCLTTLVSNELFQTEQQEWNEQMLKELQRKMEQAILSLSQACSIFIMVSNEVTYEALQYPLLVSYSRLLGRLHQTFVQTANEAYLVDSGIPIRKKGGQI
ncbi:bifunctional adenosylcobinamide kinase/adenosylcobinamide-phosphate guanylyltransferase [Niallia sp. 03133]|uniref:bifunctional adenosylcobinamide kinase/adenosylcobinamide-phosphate guanylyltransferase n=1 Tax=Niallia sp. 03133 TaxID=3458060 RepID=UPI004044831D